MLLVKPKDSCRISQESDGPRSDRGTIRGGCARPHPVAVAPHAQRMAQDRATWILLVERSKLLLEDSGDRRCLAELPQGVVKRCKSGAKPESQRGIRVQIPQSSLHQFDPQRVQAEAFRCCATRQTGIGSLRDPAVALDQAPSLGQRLLESIGQKELSSLFNGQTDVRGRVVGRWITNTEVVDNVPRRPSKRVRDAEHEIQPRGLSIRDEIVRISAESPGKLSL